MWDKDDPRVINQDMKIILTASSPEIDSSVDPRFGRGAYFLIVDPETLDWQAKPNPGKSASGGAGIRAAQFVSEQGCSAVISGDFGPNAFEALSEAGISMYTFGTYRTVLEAIDGFKSGQLKLLNSPTRPEHAGQKA
jgi:predicted Fe-Mo cluster-binding NifX family protein